MVLLFQSGDISLTLSSALLLPSQLLYSTYLLTSAKRAIDVDEELRREVCGHMSPPFEELFDGVEEHTLGILLEPWTLLLARDRDTFQKVTHTLAQPHFYLLHTLLPEGGSP